MNKKLTIIKVISSDEGFYPTAADLERWRNLFAAKKMTLEEAVATGEVEVEMIPLLDESDEDHYLTVVKIGGEYFKPTVEDLENWREIFKEAKGDPDFKIFTHPAVDVSVINIGDIVTIE
jgi:hypothetical protein